MHVKGDVKCLLIIPAAMSIRANHLCYNTRNNKQPKLGFGVNVKILNNDVQNTKVGVHVRVLKQCVLCVWNESLEVVWKREEGWLVL